MANVNAPFGLRPVKFMSGAPYSGGANEYCVPTGDGTAIFLGDPVKLAGTAQTINGIIYQDVAAAATGDKIVGVVVGVRPVTNASTIYREASTQRVLLVADDPHLLFAMQEGTGGTPFTANDMGLNANFASGAGSATTGWSAYVIDNSTEQTTNTLDLQLVSFVNADDNAIGDSARWLVRINRHQRANQVAGV